MTSIAEAPSCPRCGETMVLRTAGKGSYAGQQFWACPRFPKCWGKRGIAGQQATRPDPVIASLPKVEPSGAGDSAQATFERRLSAHRQRVRAVWPVIVGITVVLMVLAYLVGLSLGVPWLGAAAAAIVALAMLYAVMDRPQFIEAWRIGAKGERKTSDRLAELHPHGFIVLNDRLSPGYGGNIDHLAIGPTGIWAVETKSLKGSVEITNHRLAVNGSPQDKIVDQVYREATSIQIALRDVLEPLGIGVKPVLCLHRARLPFFDREVQGVRLASGRTLIRTLREGNQVLTTEQIDRIASAADRILPRPRTRPR